MAITNKTVVRIELPALPAEIVTQLRLKSNSLGLDDSGRLWLNDFHQQRTNTVNHTYIKVPELDEPVNKLYGKYFDEPLIPFISVQRNVTSTKSFTPPHCDRARNIAINYYIELGGDNVLTNFYDYHRQDDDLVAAVNLTHDQINLTESFRFETKEWYVFNAQQCHSVENIETTRIFLGIILESNPTLEEFVEKYQNYIK